jgi:hypothetical protein
MKDILLQNISDPAALEKLYQENKLEFKHAFQQLPSSLKEQPLVQAWNERLTYSVKDSTVLYKPEIIFITISIAIAGIFAKLPDLFGWENDLFYQRNAGLIVIPVLASYFLWKQKLKINRWLTPFILFAISALYINFLPVNTKSDTLLLACLHLPFFLWSIWGFTSLGENPNNQFLRVEFLKFNGNLAIMAGLLLIAAFVFTAMTFGLFNLIGLSIEIFYTKFALVWGLPAIPIIATYLVKNNPSLVNRISPLIAKIFTPLVLITLISFLFAMVINQKNPYNDREFLIIFNVMLIAVLAIILFSTTESSQSPSHRINRILLFALSLVSIVVNAIALSAIVFRLTEYGITPNRMAVLISNLLIFTNLIMVSTRLFKAIKNENAMEEVNLSIAKFLPLYSLWTTIVVFAFPVLFGFK